MTTIRIAVFSAAAVLATAALTGCATVNVAAPQEGPASAAAEKDAGHDGHDMDGHMMDGDMMDGDMMGSADPDIHFLQMMIPHHEQALLMSSLASTNGASAEVQALAAQIADAQGPEIAQMQAWLAEAGASTDMGHDMAMDGMLTDDELAALEQAQGPDFDRLFLTGMIAHHEGAIVMAEQVKTEGDDPKVAALADEIIAAQKVEIDRMKQMLGGS